MARVRPIGLLALLLCAGAAPAQPAGKPAGQAPAQPAGKPAAQAPAEPDTTAEDQRTLRGVGLAPDGPALLEYFRKRTFPEANPEELRTLIRALGADDFFTREKAFADLAARGGGAVAGLKQAESDPDVEVRRRVADLKQRIEAKAEPAVQAAAARMIGRLKPPGAAEVLLAYLPFAGDQPVIDEIARALGAVAAPGGKADPALAAALADKAALKRAVAAEALARARAPDQLPAVRRLLKDTDPAVRLRVALALIPLKEKEVLPVLVDLLGDLPPDQTWQVQEILDRLAGEQAPKLAADGSPAGRKDVRDAWRAWLAKNEATIDLAKLHEPEALLGYTLLVQQNINRAIVGGVRRIGGEVLEIDAGKKPRWKFELPTSYPVDAQVVGPDRVLVAEYQTGKVAEYDFKGKAHWEKQVGGNPIGVQRLPGGNTFVVTQNRLVEYDRAGEEKFTFQRPQHDIFRARKLRNGEISYITNSGVLTRMDSKTQRPLKVFNVNQVQILFGGVDVLPNGHVLVPEFQGNRVVEYDADGKQVGQINVQWPNSAQRLPNGNTLVASQNLRRVIEFGRNGQEVWSYQADGAVFNARRR